MAWTIGIYEREQQVIDAVQELKTAGVADDRIRIIVKNDEDAPLLTSQDDVPVEDLEGVRETRERTGGGWGLAGNGFVPAVAYYGTLQGSGPTGNTAPVAALAFDDALTGEEHTDDILHSMGIPSSFAESCAEAVNAGRYLLAAEEDDEEAGGADRLMRQAGALDVLH